MFMHIVILVSAVTKRFLAKAKYVFNKKNGINKHVNGT